MFQQRIIRRSAAAEARLLARARPQVEVTRARNSMAKFLINSKAVKRRMK
jgi:hypothetical protein